LIPEVLDSQKNQLQIKSSFSIEKINDCLKVEQKIVYYVILNREKLENIKLIQISFNEKTITQ